MKRIRQLSEWDNHRYNRALAERPEDEDLHRLYVGVAFALGNLEEHLKRLNNKHNESENSERPGLRDLGRP